MRARNAHAIVKVPPLDLPAQARSLGPALADAVGRVLADQQCILGPHLERFETAMAEYCGVPHAIGVGSGTDALLLSLVALGVGPGTLVVTTPFTFFATASTIVRLGGRPVFADIDPATFNLDPAAAAAAVDRATKAIVPVHLFGRPAPLAELAALGLPLLEDAAQAFGAEGVAGVGVCSTFSFFPTKNLFALGDGGLVACTDDDVAARVRMLRFHGSRDKQTFELVGTNSRLDAIQAAALRVFLPRLRSWNDGRREGAARYAALGLGEAVELPVHEPGHVYHMYVVRTPERARIAAALNEAGISSASYYATPLHLQPALRHLGYEPGSLPETERAAADNLALPMWGCIGADVQERVVEVVQGAGVLSPSR